VEAPRCEDAVYGSLHGALRVRRVRSVYGKTRKDVADQLAVLIAKTKAGLPLAVESWTLERFADHWLKHMVGPRLRPSTLSSYRETLRLHILPTLGGINLRALTPTHVRTLLPHKAADGLGARSIQIIHSTLRTMLSEAMREELIERNVAKVIRPPSVERIEVQPWSTEEASCFLAAAADHRLHALFAGGVALGLRKGELLALRWDDVDLEGGVLHVRQNVQRLPEMGLVFGPPKSNKSRRTIPLPAASAKVLRTHRANQAAEALALGPAWVDSGLVFTSAAGTVIEPRNLNRFFDELIAKARVRRIRFHDLRHTCGSLLLAQNVPARVVMEILGHSQLAMTTDLYSPRDADRYGRLRTPWISETVQCNCECGRTPHGYGHHKAGRDQGIQALTPKSQCPPGRRSGRR
jgi:integrase